VRLPGRLRGTTLGDLLGRLHRERATGVLELVEVEGMTRGRSHRVHFEAGLVSEVETKFPVARLGEILKQQGFVGDDALRRLTRELTRAPTRRSGEILVEDQKLTFQAVGAALRRQLRLRLDALFQLEDAELRFHVPRADRNPQIPLSPREFLHGRPRGRRAAAPAPAAAPRPNDRARVRALAVLGLDAAASRDSVQRAFRKLASTLHPDRHPGASPSERASLLQRFAELSAAYHLLVA